MSQPISVQDTGVLGDSIYQADKANALNALMDRQKAFAASIETPEEKAKDDEILNEQKENAEHKAKIIDMAAAIKKGGQNA